MKNAMPTYLYHAIEGAKLFDAAVDDIDALLASGWADSPAKLKEPAKKEKKQEVKKDPEPPKDDENTEKDNAGGSDSGDNGGEKDPETGEQGGSEADAMEKLVQAFNANPISLSEEQLRQLAAYKKVQIRKNWKTDTIISAIKKG